MTANTTFGNILSRLQGLKNVSGRRVMPGAEFEHEMSQPEMNLNGTANETTGLSEMPVNIPEVELANEIASQGNDVRANIVNQNQPEQELGMMEKIGKYLKSAFTPQVGARFQEQFPEVAQSMQQRTAAQTPPIETAQVEEAEGLPPVTSSEQKLGINLAQLLGLDEKPSLTPKFREQFPDIVANNPQVRADIEAQEAEALKKIEASNPMESVAYGSTDEVANRPDLKADVQRYFGVDFTPQEQEITRKYEKVMDNLQKGFERADASYDEQERRINERILSNATTDQDKFYIGLALAMPALIAGFFGKEAGLGALAGAAQGIAGAMQGREQSVREDEKLLADIRKQRDVNATKQGELQIERSKFPAEVKKMLPKDELEDIKGMKIVTLTDPATGDIVAQGPEFSPNLVADLQYGNTPEQRKKMREHASVLGKEQAALLAANKATKEVIDAASQLKDPGWFGQMISWKLAENPDGKLKTILRQQAPEIIVDGRKQNAYVYLDNKLELIKDAYRRSEQMKAFTQTVSEHVGEMASNPAYKGLKPSDLIDQMLSMRDRSQGFFIDRANAEGFYKEPIENAFAKENREIYSKLNKKAARKQAKEVEKLVP